MPQPNAVFSKAHLAFIRQLYMRQMQQPQAIVDLINKKYQTVFTADQIRRAINNRGWSKRRKLIVEKLQDIETKTDAQITREIANAHGRVMDDVAKGATVGLQKAVQFLANANDPRTLQAAAAGLKSLTSTFRIAAGIDNSNTHKPQTNVFSFNFAATPVRPIVAAEPVADATPALPAEAQEVADDGEEDDSPRTVNSQ